ncbi:MAG: heme o synthase [Burkholderiales bacterium]|nr:heme o synthase [Burkholderiales bacterium]
MLLIVARIFYPQGFSIKYFYSLVKPGIIFGNIITLAGGFFLAAKGNINIKLLFATIVGISLIIACGCVFNNIIDKDIDKVMERTKNRVLVQGLIPDSVAFLYALVLGLLGIFVLYQGTNYLTLFIAIFGLFIYVVLYSLYLKRHSIYGTLIGSISGSIPPVAGYCAVTNKFNLGALLLFLILSFWQIPHSYSIAIYRINDYTNAKIPVLPVVKGINHTQKAMLIYIIGFIVFSSLLSITGYTGTFYLIINIILGCSWLRLWYLGRNLEDSKKWARSMFLFSIIIITTISIIMAFDYK